MAQYLEDGYYRDSAAAAPLDERISFIRRTYLHLAVSVAALVGIEAALLSTDIGNQIVDTVFRSGAGVLVMIAAFIGAGFLARYMARADSSTPVKYLGLALYIALEAVILLPLLTYASRFVPNGVALIQQAALLTALVFGGLTLTVFITKKDFSFMGYALMLGSWLMLGLALVSVVGFFMGFGFQLGIWFSALGIALAAGYILYDTSNILHHYRTDEHVAASLELLANVVMLFYYILRLLIQTRD